MIIKILVVTERFILSELISKVLSIRKLLKFLFNITHNKINNVKLKPEHSPLIRDNVVG